MAGTLRLSNTGTGNGQSTITTAASGDTTYTLPSGGGTFVTTASTEALTVPFASGTAGSPSITFIGDTDTGIYSPGANQVAIATSGDASLYVASDGKVGIGTTNPVVKLQISNSGAEGIEIIPGDSSNESTIQSYNRSNSTNNLLTLKGSGVRFRTIGVGTSEAARIDDSGRLLVGTSTAQGSSLLQVEGTSSSGTVGADVFLRRGSLPSVAGAGLGFIYFGDNSGNLGAVIGASADGSWTSGSNHRSFLSFSTTADGASSSTERMRIHSNGCVSLSTALVVGSLASVANGVNITAAAISSGAGNSTLKYNTSSGYVTYDTSSRLVKENVVDCPYGIDALKQLQPRKYFRTDDQRDEIGFVADELVNVLPEFVPIGPKSVITKDEDDTEDIPLGVNYEKLTAVLTKALQEAIGRIESLETEVAALKAA